MPVLRWKGWAQEVARSLIDLEEFFDVTLTVGDGGTLQAHKVILAASSPLFLQRLKESKDKHPIIILTRVTFDILQALVKFIYGEEVHVDDEQMPDFLLTAKDLRIRGVESLIEVEQPPSAASVSEGTSRSPLTGTSVTVVSPPPPTATTVSMQTATTTALVSSTATTTTTTASIPTTLQSNSTTSASSSSSPTSMTVTLSNGSSNDSNSSVNSNKQRKKRSLSPPRDNTKRPNNEEPKWIKPSTPKSDKVRSSSKGGGAASTADPPSPAILPARRTKQMTLTSMSRRYAQEQQPKADLSTMEEFRGGSRMSSSSSSTSYGDKQQHYKRETTPPRSRRPSATITSAEEPTLTGDEDLFDDPDATMFVSPAKSPIVGKRTPLSPVNARNTTKAMLPPPLFASTFNNNKTSPPAIDDAAGKAKKRLDHVFNNTDDLIRGFNKLPEKRKDPDLAFKVARSKQDKANKKGWECPDCQKFYQGLESQMHPLELERLKDRCSKHRSDFRPEFLNKTPTDFWNTSMPSTQEAYARGLIRVADPDDEEYKLKPKHLL